MKIEPVIYLEIFVTQIAISSMTFTAQQKYRIRKCYPMGALTTCGVCKFWLFFGQYLAICGKWYKIGPQLLWNDVDSIEPWHFLWPCVTF